MLISRYSIRIQRDFSYIENKYIPRNTSYEYLTEFIYLIKKLNLHVNTDLSYNITSKTRVQELILIELNIRRMCKSDVNKIMEIESVSFGKHHWSPQSFISEMENPLGNYFVAIDNLTNKLVGYCGFWVIEGEAHITTIASHPDFRGNYIGEFLLQEMIRSAYKQDVKWFTLEVRASNSPAHGLYYKYGFKSLGVRRQYYQDNKEDALIMWTENINEDEFKEKVKELKQELENKDKITLVKQI